MDNNEFIIVVIILGVNELIDAFPDPSPFLSPTALPVKTFCPIKIKKSKNAWKSVLVFFLETWVKSVQKVAVLLKMKEMGWLKYISIHTHCKQLFLSVPLFPSLCWLWFRSRITKPSAEKHNPVCTQHKGWQLKKGKIKKLKNACWWRQINIDYFLFQRIFFVYSFNITWSPCWKSSLTPKNYPLTHSFKISSAPQDVMYY